MSLRDIALFFKRRQIPILIGLVGAVLVFYAFTYGSESYYAPGALVKFNYAALLNATYLCYKEQIYKNGKFAKIEDLGNATLFAENCMKHLEQWGNLTHFHVLKPAP
uniref:Polysaccharide deacetylase n=1 Tax=Panagrellus redivivus TaxID=6233 RepID=A0A7E4VMX0_PANRE